MRREGKLNGTVSIVFMIAFLVISAGNSAGSMPGMDTDLGDSHASFWGERSDQRSSRFAGGDGSASNPFQVSNVYELQNVSNNVNAHYVIVNDINASITAAWNGQRGFDPITAFNGTLDGQNFTVSNLTIDRSEDYVGLFGTIAQLGEVKNIGLVDVDVSGERYVGALAGSNDNIVENCYSTGSVYGTNYLGGLVGDKRRQREQLPSQRVCVGELLCRGTDRLSRGWHRGGLPRVWFCQWFQVHRGADRADLC